MLSSSFLRHCDETKTLTYSQHQSCAISPDREQSFFDRLPDRLKRKCWYCEAEDIRADKPVDHFRPKSKVEESEQHEGYWWLAFDWENYRCACTFCNSKRNFEDTQGGKGCHFPLFNEDNRAISPDDNHRDEIPAILDPCNPDDDTLLWFDEDGVPEPRPNADEEQIQKVENSKRIFHLHETRICRSRNRIRIEVQKCIEALNSEDRQTKLDAKAKLRLMISDTEKLSRAAFVYLSQYRHIDDVERILTQGI